MTGAAGTNQFVFNSAGTATNTIADFGASSTNELVFSNSSFSLGLTGRTTTPQAISSSAAATMFTANTTGAFANTSQRLAYDTTNGELFEHRRQRRHLASRRHPDRRAANYRLEPALLHQLTRPRKRFQQFPIGWTRSPNFG